MFVLDSSLLNAYILYAFDRRALGMPVHSRLHWHYGVATDLLRHRRVAVTFEGRFETWQQVDCISVQDTRSSAGVVWFAFAERVDCAQVVVGCSSAKGNAFGQCIPKMLTGQTWEVLWISPGLACWS